jgi:hypothetical protein
MKKYIIEREIPDIGNADEATLKGASRQSCDALNKIGSQVQWVESYVTANKTYCVYLAEDESFIKKHAEISGFPANSISEVKTMISPMTAQ